MTHLEAWIQLWLLYTECYENSFGKLLDGEAPQLSCIVLEEFACRLEAEFKKQHGIA